MQCFQLTIQLAKVQKSSKLRMTVQPSFDLPRERVTNMEYRGDWFSHKPISKSDTRTSTGAESSNAFQNRYDLGLAIRYESFGSDSIALMAVLTSTHVGMHT